MAQKNKIRIGDVWQDSKGRSLEVTGPLTANNKVPLMNLQTRRPILSKGPRALVRLVRQGGGPKITAAPTAPSTPMGYGHMAPAPAPRAPRQPAPSRAPRGKRKLTPAQIAAGFGGGGRRSPNAGPARRPKRPSATPVAMPPRGMVMTQAGPMATNPGNYPSDMARAVAVAMSSLSAADANNPMAIMAAAQGAVAQHTAGSMRNPFADPYDVDLGVGEEPYENPPPVMGPAPMGYPGQYGMGIGAHAPHAPHPMQDHYVGYPGQYGRTSHYPFG